MDDLLQCLQMADVLKPAKAAAEEVLQVLGCKIELVMTIFDRVYENHYVILLVTLLINDMLCR